jgi:hypothetical protein
MIKKFMRETGTDKKTAMDYLRQNNWNYGKAIGMYRLPQALASICEVDWRSIIEETAKALSEGLKNFAESLKKIDWNVAVNQYIEMKKEEKYERDEDRADK